MMLIKNKLFSFLLSVILLFGTFEDASFTVYAAVAGKSSFQIDFIDVGQGDASLVQCDGHYMLIDGGEAEKSNLIYAYLKQRSIKNLDVMVATHSDADHIGGLSGALNFATVGVAYCSVKESDTKVFQNFVKYLTKQGKSITVPKAGDTFSLGSAQVTVLGPIKNSEDDNNSSIVMRVVYGSTSFLFTGDAETDEEQSIMSSKRTLASTVLKVAHHGSMSSTGDKFLRSVSPRYAVISVEKDNSYGHPSEETLSKLRDAKVQVYRTDVQSHIICTSDGKTVTFTPTKNADADTLAGARTAQKSEKAAVIIPITVSEEATTTVKRVNPVRSEPAETAESKQAPAVQSAGPKERSSDQLYILNTNTHVFHSPDCKSVKQMKDKNKKEFTGSRDNVISMGYDPCKICKP